MSVWADRVSAAKLLVRVEDGAFASRLLARSSSAGVRARLLGVLRWQRRLDETLTPHCRRPLGKLDPQVRAVLRLGLFESAVLGVPAPVATDAAVRTIQKTGKTSAAGLVNAVLRRAAPGWGSVAAGNEAIEFSHPDWIVERWRRNMGSGATTCALSANQTPAPMWVWFRDDDRRRGMAGEGVQFRSHPWCSGAWTVPDDSRRLVRAVKEGSAHVQDPSSQLVAQITRSLAPIGAHLVDLCAAPGGKTAWLQHHHTWGGIVALDRHPARLALVGTLLSRGSFDGVQLAIADGAAPPVSRQSVEVVLLDAPCTGTGTLRRHPDLRWRLNAGSISEAVSGQRRLFEAGLDLLAPGGVMIYSTCSVEPEENEGVVGELPSGYAAIPLAASVPAEAGAAETDAAGVRIPPTELADGFSIHAIRRN